MKLIMAMSLNGVIGIDGKLPWDVPGDRKLFRNLTRDGILVMGRRTFQSLPSNFNKAEREVWVISRYQRHIPGADRVMSIESLGQAWHQEDVKDRMWICGGEEVYHRVVKTHGTLVTEYHVSIIHRVIGSERQRFQQDKDGVYLVNYSPIRWDNMGRLVFRTGADSCWCLGDEPEIFMPNPHNGYTYMKFVRQ